MLRHRGDCGTVGRLTLATARPSFRHRDHATLHLLKILALAIAALLGFFGGWVLTLRVLMHAMAPSSGCASPCDAPAYAAVGLSIVAGPVIGVLMGGVGAMLVARLFGRTPAP